MSMSGQLPILKIKIRDQTNGWREGKFRKLVLDWPAVIRIDLNQEKRLARVISQERLDFGGLKSHLISHDFEIEEVGGQSAAPTCLTANARPSFWQLVGFFVLVFFLGLLLSKLGLLKPGVAVGEQVSFAAAFLLGLLAASSSCLVVAGGLLLASAQKFHERYGGQTRVKQMKPVLAFVLGRLLAYGFLGGLIGLVGRALSPSPLVTGLITILAAVYMFVMGLEMLHLAPRWLKRLMPRMPQFLGRKIMAQEEKSHPLTPFLLGAGTFFLPCGFTQALQLYVLTTGSALQGALLLFAFALGTAPALVGLGWASGSFKGKLGQFFFRFSGALVIVLGLWNIQNGLTMAGYPLAWPRFSLPERAIAAPSERFDPRVEYDGEEQRVKIDVSYAGYDPNSFTLQRGVPTRLLISGEGAGLGCLAGFQIPKLGIRRLLTKGQTAEIAFTPQQVGIYIFSCSMGMFRGSFTVTES